MQKHALEVPAIAIECSGLEVLAERYAIDSPQRSPVAKSELDHDSYDLAALSNYVPYCAAGTTDRKAAGIIQRAFKKMKLPAPPIFTLREVENFTAFIRDLPAPITEIDARIEALNAGVQCLILVPSKPNNLIEREAFPPERDVEREMLPLGGLKIWSRAKLPWSILYTELQQFHDELECGNGKDAVLYGLRSSSDTVTTDFEIRIPFGMFDLAKKEIEQAFAKMAFPNAQK
jgi:hypothetical protein